MSILGIILIIVILVVLLVNNSFLREFARDNKFEIKNLQKSLNDLKTKLNSLELKEEKPIVNKSAIEQEVKAVKAVKEEVQDSAPIIVSKEEPTHLDNMLESFEEEEDMEQLIDQIADEKHKEKVQSPIEKPTVKQTITPPVKTSLKKDLKKSFFEKHPDIEKFIGESLINKIGIVILVLGLGFLVKYAIDKNWINEIGRVAIGVLSAGGLIGLAHKLRKDYKPFSSVLIGGGLALLYFTITVAFHSQGYPLYQQQTLAFIILILITVFAIFLSISYNRIEIAILAMLGGFASPMLISTGSGNYIVLFTYLTILNIGLLVLSYNKKWRLVNILAFAFTVLLFSTWLTSELLDSKHDTFNGAIFFATGFYVIFFLMNMVYNIKYKLNFKVGDISLLLSNTFIYFTFMMLMLNHIGDGQYKGLFSVLLGAFNFGFAYFIHYRKKADNNLLYLLIGLVFTFITLAIPLQLEGNYITLFWAIESVLLLWLSQKSGFTILKIGSLVVLLLMLISLVMDWENSYTYIALQTEDSIKTLTLIFNKMFLTTIVSVASLVAIFALLRNKDEDSKNWFVPNSLYRLIILGIAIIVFYIGGYLEANYQSLYYFAEYSSRNVLIITYNALFVTALLLYSTIRYNRNLAIITSVISTMFVLVFLFSLSSTFSESIRSYISGDEVLATTLLIMRWISVFAVYFISVLLFKLFRKINNNNTNEISKASTVLLVITVLYLLSSDLDSISILIAQSSDILIHTQKTGYAILWGVSSFLLMIIGMKRKNKTLRILSLILFAITLVKLFVYDLSEISEGGKIVAFILLGILLLIVSFMYQKVKKLIVEDDFSISDKKEKTTISK